MAKWATKFSFHEKTFQGKSLLIHNFKSIYEPVHFNYSFNHQPFPLANPPPAKAAKASFFSAVATSARAVKNGEGRPSRKNGM